MCTPTVLMRISKKRLSFYLIKFKKEIKKEKKQRKKEMEEEKKER